MSGYGYQPGNVRPCPPYRKRIPYFGMEGFYLERIAKQIRDAIDASGYDRRMRGLYFAIERCASTGEIHSHSVIGSIETIKRYAASVYAAVKENERHGYDAVVTGVSLSTYAEFPLAPGRKCSCERCEQKQLQTGATR